jgi:hypothetical protein
VRKPAIAAGVVAAAVSFAVIPSLGSTSVAATRHPSISDFKLSAAALSDKGGTVVLSAKITKAKNCHITVVPRADQTTVTPCGAGPFQWLVPIPGNLTHRTITYKVGLQVFNSSGHSGEVTKTVSVKATPTPPPPPPTTTTTAPKPPPTTTPSTTPPLSTPPTTAFVEPTVTEFYYVTANGVPGGIGIAGGDVTFTYDTFNPNSNSACMFTSPGAPVIQGPSGNIPCNQQLTSVVDIPGGALYSNFNFTVSPGLDSQGNRVFDTITITEV